MFARLLLLLRRGILLILRLVLVNKFVEMESLLLIFRLPFLTLLFVESQTVVGFMPSTRNTVMLIRCLVLILAFTLSLTFITTLGVIVLTLLTVKN